MSITSERLREVIEKSDLSYADIEKITGIAKSSVQRYAAGVTKKIPIDAAQKIAEAVGANPRYVLGWEGGNAIQFSITVDDIRNELNKRKSDNISSALSYAPTGYAPILGSIPAGHPALATEAIKGYEPVTVSNPEDCFWLRVQGDSMINAGIQTGDLVLIRAQPCAEEGQIVACRVDGDESTLKRFRRQGDTIFLMPENSNYNPYIVPVSDFENGYASIIGVALEIKRKL